MRTLLTWWAETLGWEGTYTLALILCSGLGIAACAWALGADHERRRAYRQRRALWREQEVLK